MKRNTREVFHMNYDFYIAGYKDLLVHRFNGIDLSDVFNMLKIAFDNSKLHPKSADKGREKLYLHKMELDPTTNIVKFIVARSDRNAAPPVISDLDKKKRDTILLSDSEGVDYSAHVLFRLDCNVMLFESVTNINSVVLESFFRNLFRQVKKLNSKDFERSHPTDDTKKVSIQPKFSLRGIVSDSLKEDIESGKLNNVIFIKDIKTGTADNHGFSQTKSLLEVKPTILSAVKLDALVNLFKEKSSLYDFAKINIKKSDGQTATSTFKLNSDHLDSLDATYFKKNTIKNITPPLNTSHDEFHAQICSTMITEIKRY